jgi:hypothetical protein
LKAFSVEQQKNLLKKLPQKPRLQLMILLDSSEEEAVTQQTYYRNY